VNEVKINLWYSTPTSQWRWTLVDDRFPNLMESGQAPDIHKAMEDVANTVDHLTEGGSPLGLT